MAHEVVPKHRQSVQSGDCKERIREVAVDILGGMEDGTIAPHAEVQLKQTKIEHVPVPDEGDNAETGMIKRSA